MVQGRWGRGGCLACVGSAGRRTAAAPACAPPPPPRVPTPSLPSHTHTRAPFQESFDSPIDRRSDYYRVAALQERAARRALQPQPLLTPPNVCTFARVLMVPLFMLLWFTAHRYASIATATVFILASITDWLDGYLARRLKIVSAFGAFLDPVADKIM